MSSKVIKCRTRTSKGLHAEFSFTWKMTNFHRGYSIVSPIFSSNLYFKDLWQLHCDPRAVTIEGENYVGIKLRLISSDEDQIMAQYNFSVLSENGLVGNTVHSRVCQFKAGEYRGCTKFIKRSELTERQPIIFCRVKMIIEEYLVNRLWRIRGQRQRIRTLWRRRRGKGERKGQCEEEKMRPLTELCQKLEDGIFDMNIINIENAAELLKFVIDRTDLEVRKQILQFIKTHFGEFVETNGYKMIKEHYPKIRTKFLQEIAEEEKLL